MPPPSNGHEATSSPHVLSYTSLDLGHFQVEMTVAWGQTPGGFALLHRWTSFRCGVQYKMVEARTAGQHVTCDSIRRPASPIAKIPVISRQFLRSVVVKQVAWRLVAMGNVDAKSGDVSNVDEYSYGRQILCEEARQVWLTLCTRFSHCRRRLQVILYGPIGRGPSLLAPTNQIGVVLRLMVLLSAASSSDHPIDSGTPVVDQAKRRTPRMTLLGK